MPAHSACATEMIRRDANPWHVKELLGHEDARAHDEEPLPGLCRARHSLETSLFSRLPDPVGSPKRRITESFLRSARLTHRLVFGAVVIDEILETRGRLHREAILDRTWGSGAELLPLHDETDKMAKDLLAAGQWSGRRIADMVHVAYTLLADADALVTWAVDDLARPRPRTIVHAYARRLGMPAPLI